MSEPTVISATQRFAEAKDGIEEIYIECRMSDGQKGAFVIVDASFPELANKIEDLFNGPQEKRKPTFLTCVYCGTAYPKGTPPHGAQVLTDHIKVCPEHPLRAAEEKIAKLREALIGLVGEFRKDKLEEMIHQIDTIPGVPDADRIVTIKAMRTLIETAKD